MNHPRHDITPLLHPGDDLGTGPRRTRRPVYLSHLAPCQEACPVSEDIQAWLAQVQAGQHYRAWTILAEANPLPGVHGRVCYHPCESGCNRVELDGGVSIHAVERLLGDLAAKQGWRVPLAPPSGKRVLVIGSGPAGLSAAYHLCRLGHAVEIHEAGDRAGGTLRTGIPAYRLPRDVLRDEIRRIQDLGVKIVLNSRIDDVAATREAGSFDAVFVAIGNQLGKRIALPGDSAHVITAVDLLRQTDAGKPPVLGRRVAVYGAGNTAMDAARTAVRLGAQDVTIVFIGDRARMEAHAFEANEAESEGVRFRWLAAIRAVGNGTMTLEDMAPDASGTPQPTGIHGVMEADTLVLALGQRADSAFLAQLPGVVVRPDGAVPVDGNLMTGAPGIYAGGDLVPGDRTVTRATGDGRRAAQAIDAWLRGVEPALPLARPRVSFAMMNLPLFTVRAATAQREAPAASRAVGFGEVLAALTPEQAQREANRCLSCGNCFECDQCYAACPEDAIVRQGRGNGYRIDPDRCTGCAVCVDQCPCHAMDMQSEEAAS